MESIEYRGTMGQSVQAGITLACALARSHRRTGEGVSSYLPLNLEPEMERQIERVLILADEPILKRPFSVALVEYALAAGMHGRQTVVRQVKRYLQRYSRDYGGNSCECDRRRHP